MSQRRSGVLESAAGIESEAGRRAWGSGNPGTREPAGGLGIATYLPRSAGMRAHGQRTRLPRETKHKYRNKIKDFQKWKTKRGEWAPLTVFRSSLLSQCTHEEDAGTRRRGRKLK